MAGIYWGNNACIGLAHSYCSTLTVFWDWYSWLLLFDSAFGALEGAGVVGFRFVMVVRGGRVVVCEGWLFAEKEKEGGAKTAGLSQRSTHRLTPLDCLSAYLFRLVHVLVQQVVVFCSCRQFIVYICT